jgi:hypothetical protein
MRNSIMDTAAKPARTIQISLPAALRTGCEQCDYPGADVQRHAEETGHATWLEMVHRTIYRRPER